RERKRWEAIGRPLVGIPALLQRRPHNSPIAGDDRFVRGEGGQGTPDRGRTLSPPVIVRNGESGRSVRVGYGRSFSLLQCIAECGKVSLRDDLEDVHARVLPSRTMR